MFSSGWFMAMFTCMASFFKKEGTFPQTATIVDHKLDPPYDFIIVGAGSAGSVIANRLSEIKDWKILLLESGGLENEISDTPLFAANLWRTQMDWNYTTTKQQICKGFDGECLLIRGHVLGGSSTLNYMNYVRGNKYDYDNWEHLGNTGWGYNDVLPYFLKSEGMVIDELKSTKYHNSDGPLTISYSNYKTQWRDLYISAAQELGYKQRDYNGEFQTGIDYVQFNIRDGSRCSTAKAFLNPLKERSNVHIITGARVTQVVIDSDEDTKRATGVKFIKNGEEYTIEAKKEVILSAGSINSPKILMLSGIGKKEHLEELKIPVNLNLPVGDNLQDHSVVIMSFGVNESLGFTRKKFEQSDVILAYTKGEGMLSSPMGIEAVGHFSLSDDPEQDVPDFQVFFLSISYFDNTVPAFTLASDLLRPKSVGTLRLKSSNPDDLPIIDPKYLTEEEDMQNVIKICKVLLKLSLTKPLEKFSPQFIEPKENCAPLKENEDDFCKCVIEFYSDTMYHPIGTAHMGSDPQTSVVSSYLLVHGTSNLRVVDGSVMPKLTSGNTNAPIIMIGEKASDIIKLQWETETSES